jgi:hypothetical protein
VKIDGGSVDAAVGGDSKVTPDALVSIDLLPVVIDAGVADAPIRQDAPIASPDAVISMDRTPGSGLVAYYPFHGDVKDYSGYGNSSPVGSVTFGTDRFGNPSGAAVFGGTNYLQYSDAAQLHFVADVTLAAWMSTTQYTSDPTHLYGIVTKGTANPNVGPQLGITTRSGKMVALGEVNGLLQDIVSSQTISDGTWHFLCFTVDSESQMATLYVDGSPVSSDVYTGTDISNTNPLFIGIERLATYVFAGSISDVRIYNRALSVAEVGELYATGDPYP